jgi:hypothetical protein
MCTFTISFTGSAKELVRRAKQTIEREGGTFVGDAIQGDFKGKTAIGSIQGKYQVEGQSITLSIIKKPLLLSCNRIQKELSAVLQ